MGGEGLVCSLYLDQGDLHGPPVRLSGGDLSPRGCCQFHARANAVRRFSFSCALAQSAPWPAGRSGWSINGAAQTAAAIIIVAAPGPLWRQQKKSPTHLGPMAGGMTGGRVRRFSSKLVPIFYINLRR